MADYEEHELQGPYGAKINLQRDSGLSFQTFHQGQTKSTFNAFFTKSFIEDTGKSNMITTTLGIMNTVMGAGTIALPFVLREFGFVLGVIMIVGTYLLTVLTCRYLLMAKNLSGLKDYKQLGFKLFRKPGEVFIKMIIIVNNVGLNISYFIIFGDALKNVFTPFCKDSSSWYCNHFFYSKAFFVICIAGIQFPLIFARHMAKIKVVSYISITGISIFSIGCIITFFIKVHKHTIPPMNWVPSSDTWDTKKALACFTDIFLAYTFHFNWFPLYRSLEKPTNKRMMTCGKCGLGGCCTVYLIVAMAGVAAYGDKVNVNFINCFDVNDIGKPLYIIINLGYAACCCSSLPFFFFEGRNYVLSLYGDIERLFVKDKKEENEPLNQENLLENSEYNIEDETQKALKKEEDLNMDTEVVDLKEVKQIQHIDKERSLTFFIIFSICMYCSIVVVGIFLNDLGIVFGIISSICANCVAYIFPSTFYLRLAKKRGIYYKAGIAVLIFGFCSGIVCFVANMLQL